MITAKDRMMSYLPPYYRESRVMNAVMEARGKEIDRYNDALNEILDQFYISTATWGLSYYEEKYGLPVNENSNVQTRRQFVLAKKRSGRSSLIKMLQAVEPTITFIGGKLRLPFTIYSDDDIYNFSPLIVLLERYKPAHLGYIFQLLPSIEASGYTVYANHKTRDKVILELKSGTVMTGRWPRWNSIGRMKQIISGIKAVSIAGDGFFDIAADLYSGPIREKSSVGAVFKFNTGVQSEQIAGNYLFPVAVIKCGKAPEDSSLGTMQQAFVQTTSMAITGSWPFPFAGVSVGTVNSFVVEWTNESKAGVWIFPYAGASTSGTIPDAAATGYTQVFQIESSDFLATGICMFPLTTIQCGKMPEDSSMGKTQQASAQILDQAITGTGAFSFTVAGGGSINISTLKLAGVAKTGAGRFFSCGPYHSGEEVA